MPYELPLPNRLKTQRWKIKVWDKELGEDPHVTIVHMTQWWRWGLRDRKFMDTSPDPATIPKEVVAELTKDDNYPQPVPRVEPDAPEQSG